MEDDHPIRWNVITITGISDHLRLEWPITITGMRSLDFGKSVHLAEIFASQDATEEKRIIRDV